MADASIAVAWCIDDERTDRTDALFVRAGDDGLVVPSLWYLEIANVLFQAERRRRLEPGATESRFAIIADVPIDADFEAFERAFREVLTLARAHNLTIYDATYLELALRTNLPLATLDRDLAAAARREGIEVLIG